MKIFRGFCAVLAGIVTLPIVLLIEVVFIGYAVCACLKANDGKKILEVWGNYVQSIISTNQTFINNINLKK